jgi:hypothetical protein
MALPADLLEKPGATAGHRLGYGAWRIAVQIYAPTAGAGLWDVAEWDEILWGGGGWEDISHWVRGIEWTRGASWFNGRPAVGVATVTLDNRDFRWSGIDPTNSHGDWTQLAGSEVVNTVFAPGTLMRIVCWDPTDATDDGFVPQITGEVESWPEARRYAGRDSYVDVTFVETISRLGGVDELALGAVEGDDDDATERVERLADAADWPYGYVHHTTGATYNTWPLQSTDMANNRLGEIYLTVDSVGAVARTDRTGQLTTYERALAPTRGPLPDPVCLLAALSPARVMDEWAAGMAATYQLGWLWALNGTTALHPASELAQWTTLGDAAYDPIEIPPVEVAQGLSGFIQRGTQQAATAMNAMLLVSVPVGGAKCALMSTGAATSGAILYLHDFDLVWSQYTSTGPVKEGVRYTLPGPGVYAVGTKKNGTGEFALFVNGAKVATMTATFSSAQNSQQSLGAALNSTGLSLALLGTDSGVAISIVGTGVVIACASMSPAIQTVDDVWHADYYAAVFGPRYCYADPEEVVWDNDLEPVINAVQLARVGGTVQEASDVASIQRHGRRTYGRYDLVNKSDTLTLDLAEAFVYTRTLRLAELTLDGDADNRALAALISLDVHNPVTVKAPAADGGLISVTGSIDELEHRVTPVHPEEPVRWTATYTLGAQSAPTYTAP